MNFRDAQSLMEEMILRYFPHEKHVDSIRLLSNMINGAVLEGEGYAIKRVTELLKQPAPSTVNSVVPLNIVKNDGG